MNDPTAIDHLLSGQPEMLTTEEVAELMEKAVKEVLNECKS